jgi:hypothetical protein
MDSGGKSDHSLTVPDGRQSGGLLRAVSFPNYFRGFWDHHQHLHSDESECNSALSSRAPSVHHIPEPIVEGGIVVNVPSDAAGVNTVTDFQKPNIKVGGFDPASPAFFIGSLTPSDSAQSRTSDGLSLMAESGHSALAKPSLSSATAAKPPLPTLDHRHGSLLTALFHHDLAHVSRLNESQQLTPEQHQHRGGAEQQDRGGLFGLPSRVRVTGRELNMMSPISF